VKQSNQTLQIVFEWEAASSGGKLREALHFKAGGTNDEGFLL
jgi:hypothetical protein